MGFNISSGKLGRTTILKSARKSDKTGSKITINLPDLVKTGSFDVLKKNLINQIQIILALRYRYKIGGRKEILIIIYN